MPEKPLRTARISGSATVFRRFSTGGGNPTEVEADAEGGNERGSYIQIPFVPHVRYYIIKVHTA